MKIDHCLILAAGFGTRMGPIGSSLPKVLWPVFEKNLLHLQILYAKKIGVKKIYINLHHQSTQIKHFIESLHDHQVKILEELPEILDIGGGIHNLASQVEVNYQGTLLVLNSDQFLIFPEVYFEQGLKKIENHTTCLFGIQVDKSGKYNQTVIDENGYLQKIVPEKEVVENQFWTYSGLALVNLARLRTNKGSSKFFDTVAPFKNESVPFIKLEKLSYWDFGTVARYQSSMFSILKKIATRQSDSFIEFLFFCKAVLPEKISPDGYNSQSRGVIDLTDGTMTAFPGSIILQKTSTSIPKDKAVVVFGSVQTELL
ncbi:MAG: nucleotidyltransferase family protein [Bacteriovoracaceae bacterium]